MARADAQRRADRIRAFQEELAEAESTLGPLLAGESRDRLSTYHESTLTRLAAEWDVDRTAGEQQLSLGMRVASLVGAIALTAAVFLYFYRIWGAIPTAAQLVMVTALPLAALWLTEFAARRERTHYFATIAAILASASFMLAVTVIGGIYNMPSSPMALIPWGAFTLALGLGFRFPLLTLAGALALTVGIAGLPLSLLGMSWTPDNGRFERYVVAGKLAMAAPVLWRGRLAFEDAESIRLAGLLVAAMAVIACSSSGDLSLLPFSRGVTEGIYDVAGFVGGAAALWIGLRNGWRWTARAAGGFLVLFTYTKAFDWWWELLPNYLFFLVLAAIAILALVVLRQIRQGPRKEAA